MRGPAGRFFVLRPGLLMHRRREHDLQDMPYPSAGFPQMVHSPLACLRNWYLRCLLIFNLENSSSIFLRGYHLLDGGFLFGIPLKSSLFNVELPYVIS